MSRRRNQLVCPACGSVISAHYEKTVRKTFHFDRGSMISIGENPDQEFIVVECTRDVTHAIPGMIYLYYQRKVRESGLL